MAQPEGKSLPHRATIPPSYFMMEQLRKKVDCILYNDERIKSISCKCQIDFNLKRPPFPYNFCFVLLYKCRIKMNLPYYELFS